MIRIDGSAGEGGGQILRTALGLSLVTGQPFQIEGIRAGRQRPGLLRQHLTAVKAAAEVGSAEVDGAELGSRTLAFRPRAVKPGDYRFAIGSAGSTTLVLQTVLPALMTAGAPSTVTLEGGTHNMQAPPFEFLDRCFAPVLRAMGFGLTLTLNRYGFYPAGGGRITAAITPCDGGRPAPLALLTRGEIAAHRATAIVVNLRRDIGKRELGRVIAGLGWPREVLHLDDAGQADCAGNVLFLETEATAPVTEIVTAFGQLGVSAEAVGDSAVAAMREYLDSDAPVGEHLADQLLIPLALGAGGEFRAVKASLHTTTNIDTIERFLPGRFHVTQEAGAVRIGWPAGNGKSLS